MHMFFKCLLISTSLLTAQYMSCIPDIDFCRLLPKAELHLHLGGSFPIEYLRTIATEEQMNRLEDGIDKLAAGMDYHEAFAIFALVTQIVDSNEKVKNGVTALLKSMEQDGVVYAEIRTGLKNLEMAKHQNDGFENYLLAVIEGIEQGRSDAIDARLVLSLQRASSLEIAAKTIDLAIKYRSRGIAGIDISGDSTIGAIEQIMPQLLRAKLAGLFITLHIGESPKEKNQLNLLEALNPERIGHGVFLSDEALAWIREHKTPVEMCLTSAKLVRMIDDYAQHPGLQLLKEGHPVVICTDDPLIFKTSLSREYQLCAESADISAEELARIACDSIKYTCCATLNNQ